MEIELFGISRSDATVTHVPLADPVRDLDPGQDDVGTPEILETHHWFDDARCREGSTGSENTSEPRSR